MQTVTRTPTIIAALTAYWNAYHIWQVCKADPCAGYNDLKNCADICADKFEWVCRHIWTQHRKQHGRIAPMAEIRLALRDEITDVVNARYNAQEGQ